MTAEVSSCALQQRPLLFVERETVSLHSITLEGTTKLAFRSERPRNLVSFKNTADFFMVRTVKSAIDGVSKRNVTCKRT